MNDLLPSDPASNQSSSREPSVRSDLEYAPDSDAFEIEQESAKLQAEVHKLSRELEELMNSRRFTDSKKRDDAAGIGAVGELGEEDNFEEEEEGRGTSRFPMDSDRVERVENLPQKRESPAFPSRLREPDPYTSAKFESFGANAPRPPPPEKHRLSPDPEISFKEINEKLTKHGFPSIPAPDDSGALDPGLVLERLHTVLMDFTRSIEALDVAEVSNKQKQAEAAQAESDSLRKELKRVSEAKAEDKVGKETERQLASLRAKLDTAHSLLREKDEEIEALRREEAADFAATEKERLVFKRHFGREPKSAFDAKVATVVKAAEDRKARHTPEPNEISALKDQIKDLKSRLQQQSLDLEKSDQLQKSLSEENAKLRAKQSLDSPASSDILAQAMSILQLKREKQLPVALAKMQQVIRALPGLEAFIKSVSAEVLSSDTSPQSVEAVLPTLRTWKQKAIQWESLQSTRKHLCHALRLDPTSSFDDIVTTKQLAAVKQKDTNAVAQHFREMFELTQEEDIFKSMNQVFLFVHEMKGLLQVRSTQYSREVLGVDADTSIPELLEHIKYRLQL